MTRYKPVLYILALVLLLILFLMFYFLFFVDPVPRTNGFAVSLDAAGNALSRGRTDVFRREIMRSGKYAVEIEEWKELLALTASAVEDEDYRLFSTMAGRAVVQNPGNDDLLAYWVWSLLRNGNVRKAVQYAPALDESRWNTLQAEVRIKSLSGGGDDDLQIFSKQINEKLDPDFFSYASSLSGSAELAVDAALMYMQTGNRRKAYEIAWAVMNDNRNWYSVERIPQSIIAMAKIAYEGEYFDDAANWLSSLGEDIGWKWQDAQFAGDVYWQRYSLGGEKEDAIKSLIYWNKAINTIKENDEKLPQSSWRIWLNRVLALNELHSLERAGESLQEALTVFPEKSQVKAAWAIANAEFFPSLAWQFLQSRERDPALEFAKMKIAPVPENPRVYESDLWQLFNEVTEQDKILKTDSRNITLFLMDYLWKQNDFSSMDIVISRYQNSFGNEDWMLPWIILNDVARNVPVINLLPEGAEKKSNYERIRQIARKRMEWKVLHDVVLYALFAVQNLYDIQSTYTAQSGESGASVSSFEAAVLLWLLDTIDTEESVNPVLEHRISLISTERQDLIEEVEELKQKGRRDTSLMLSVRESIDRKIDELLRNSREDIKMVYEQHSTGKVQLVRLEKLLQDFFPAE